MQESVAGAAGMVPSPLASSKQGGGKSTKRTVQECLAQVAYLEKLADSLVHTPSKNDKGRSNAAPLAPRDVPSDARCVGASDEMMSSASCGSALISLIIWMAASCFVAVGMASSSAWKDSSARRRLQKPHPTHSILSPPASPPWWIALARCVLNFATRTCELHSEIQAETTHWARN